MNRDSYCSLSHTAEEYDKSQVLKWLISLIQVKVYSSEVSHYSCIVFITCISKVKAANAPQTHVHHWFYCIKLKRKHSLWYLINCYINNICTTTTFWFLITFSQKPFGDHCQLHCFQTKTETSRFPNPYLVIMAKYFKWLLVSKHKN